MLAFNFEGWYFCDIDSKVYAKEAIAAFHEHLYNYVKETAANAEARGYTTKGRLNEFDDVKWLVFWTVKKRTKDEILVKMDEERSARFETEKTTDISTLNKAFRKFRNFDLPVREE